MDLGERVAQNSCGFDGDHGIIWYRQVVGGIHSHGYLRGIVSQFRPDSHGGD
jgi:hypothetical protein